MVKYCNSKKCLAGKTAIVTGSNTGIGFETASEFAKRGCRVILACRNEAKANAARTEIIEKTGNDNVIVKIVNLESLQSVREFCQNIIQTEPRLDILVNNAAAIRLPDIITPDGLQLEMAVNYFSSFLLTNLLLDLLKKSAPSRIINVSSEAARYVWTFNVEDLNKCGNSMLYSKTKLCNILFTIELAKRLEGSNVSVYSVHPGAVHTQMQGFSSVFNFVAKHFFRSPEQGSQTILYCALETDIEKHSGQHFSDCEPVQPYYHARNPENAAKLWEVSEKLVGLQK